MNEMHNNDGCGGDIMTEEIAVSAEKPPIPSVNNALLARCARILFWLIIASLLLSLLTGETISEKVPALAAGGQAANIIVAAAYGFVLYKMSAEGIRYRGAALCRFISAAFSILLLPMSADSENPLVVIMALVAVVIDMIGEYYEYMGHTDVLADVDRKLSGKWFRLWKWYLAAFLGIFAGTVLAVMIPILGMLVMLVCTVGTVIVGILKIVFTYKMAKAFEKFMQSRNGAE